MPPRPNPQAASVAPYVPGEQPTGGGFVKLNTNEFPHEAAPEVLEAIRREAADTVRLYPSPRCERLRAALASRYGVAPDHVLVTNGSDEALRVLIQAYGGAGRVATVVDPSYSLYPTLLAMFGTECRSFALEGMTGFPREVFERRSDLMLVPVPNAPIGNSWGRAELARLAGSHELLVLDEAYADFADPEGRDHFDMVREGGSVVVTRTFSKSFGLAGMRVGCVVGPPEIVRVLDAIADSYNVNRVSQAAALAALEASEHYAAKGAEILRDRAWLSERLAERGFLVHSSQANFVFAERDDARALYESLKARRILVRYFPRPPLERGLRITIGRREELEALLAGIDAG